jgi:hypothetical protein
VLSKNKLVIFVVIAVVLFFALYAYSWNEVSNSEGLPTQNTNFFENMFNFFSTPTDAGDNTLIDGTILNEEDQVAQVGCEKGRGLRDLKCDYGNVNRANADLRCQRVDIPNSYNYDYKIIVSSCSCKFEPLTETCGDKGFGDAEPKSLCEDVIRVYNFDPPITINTRFLTRNSCEIRLENLRAGKDRECIGICDDHKDEFTASSRITCCGSSRSA